MTETRKLPYPQDGNRVETGPVMFGDDWTGLFIRGDDAFGFALSLRAILDEVNEGRNVTRIHKGVVEGLLSDLMSTRE